MYVDFNAGNNSYKLRLNVRSTVLLEKQLGCNPLSVFGKGDTIPTITSMVQILHASLQQYEHGINLDTAQDIFEAWLNDGHTVNDFIEVIIDIYRVSGIIKNEKNA
jgi:hypothetical protein